MSQRTEWWFSIIRAACATITVMMVLYLIFLVGPVLETRWNPVLDKLQIQSVTPISDKESELFVAFRKRRDCEYVGMAWFRDDGQNGLDRVALVQMRPPGDVTPPNRPLGLQRAGPWHVAIPADQIRTKSVVEVLHRCHPFWMTRTRFYP